MDGKKFDLSLFLACLVGAAVGFGVAELLYQTVTASWAEMPGVGLYFAVVVFFICLAGLISELVTHNLNGAPWEGGRIGRGFLFLIIVTAAFFALSMLAQFIYGLGMSSRKLENIDDYIILIDNSGSTMITDPNDERFSAVESFVETLDADNNVMVEVFTHEIDGYYPLAPVSDTLKADLAALFSQYNNIDDKGTDIQMVLEQVITDYQQTGRSAVVLMLSDGESDVDVDSVSQVYTAAGIPIYCIGFSGNQASGSGLLQELADGTGGYYVEIDELSNLTETVGEMVNLASRRMLLEPRRGTDAENMTACILRIVLTLVLGVVLGLGLAFVLASQAVLTVGVLTHGIAALAAALVLEFGMQSFLPAFLVRLLLCLLLGILLVWYEDNLIDAGDKDYRQGIGYQPSGSGQGYPNNSGVRGGGY